MLQGKSIVGEVLVPDCMIRCKALALPHDFRGLLILPLCCVRQAQIVVRSVFPWVVLNPLQIYLRRFVQFSGHVLVVVGSDGQLLPLAGMFPQLKCFRDVLTGSLSLSEKGIAQAYCPVAHRKIWIELDGT